MSDALAAPPREQGWTRIVIALVAFLLLSHAPVVRAAAPVVDTLVLLVPALAACFIAGWRKGGSSALALAWAALAALLLAIPSRPGSEAYADLVRSWGVLVAGALGLVCILGWRRQFLGRALAAVGIAALIAAIGMAFAPHAAGRIEDVFARELRLRNSAVLAQWARGFPNASFAPSMREWAARRAMQLQQASGSFAVLLYPALLALESLAACALAWGLYHRMSRARLGAALAPFRYFRFNDELIWALVAGMTIAVLLYPALLALESLAACALAWGLYHRMSRARLGAALAPFRYFRFNDELIWALVAGMTITILPTLEALRVFGANLVVFFGALYALRGFGVVAWFSPQLTLGAQLAASVAAVVLFPVSLALAVGLGVTDTWIDWRRRMRTADSPAGPGATR